MNNQLVEPKDECSSSLSSLATEDSWLRKKMIYSSLSIFSAEVEIYQTVSVQF